MIGTLADWISGLAITKDRDAMRTLFSAIADRLSSCLLSTGGLAIKTASSAVVKAGTAFYAIAKGKMVYKAANTDMAALSGTVTNAKYNVYVFFVDAEGTLTAVMGTEASTLAGVKFPATPEQKAILGWVLINPTGTGNFVGGTTALDDATVVPNAVYVNTPYPVDPNILLR